jgi:hypothetical protein
MSWSRCSDDHVLDDCVKGGHWWKNDYACAIRLNRDQGSRLRHLKQMPMD